MYISRILKPFESRFPCHGISGGDLICRRGYSAEGFGRQDRNAVDCLSEDLLSRLDKVLSNLGLGSRKGDGRWDEDL